ncbi:Gis4p KNAG_0B03710 [Huiozyma naganishii CBS 8797]|uniref:Protein GIS4 n=1 Tax=Huiozyma naganishii (strain ATCC MYA-139 / BCRC 22969 / CBS 8797 / KCTC 17520 / NBRC 10181 / NCYC 3082 / Yp74L-3) TaxID=1071383 RepID=J7RV79_HUIN7|nr:hypothetical protein KNAG_0B03710 [Kazachstania naganishii CBS 8797]CCK68812.1 hypothetical protein KNAG_0B03710 [Kazachstania naganishii CBS 8797]
MQKSIRVNDYYDNDDNGLWSWYLQNIRSGDFEELTHNELKYTLLKRFLKNHFTSLEGINSKILFISIPDKVHSDISVLETFLKDYFHLEDLQNIKIQKLTTSNCYNHENHYLLTDTLNNFNDRKFLRYLNPGRKFENSGDMAKLDGVSGPLSIYGTTTSTTVKNEDDFPEEVTAEPATTTSTSTNASSLVSNHAPIQNLDKSHDLLIIQNSTGLINGKGASEPIIEDKTVSNSTTCNNNGLQPNGISNKQNGIKSERIETPNESASSESSGLFEDGASSIVLDFPRSKVQAQKRKVRSARSSVSGSNASNNPLLNTALNNSNLYTPASSELVSFNSYYNEEEDASSTMIYNSQEGRSGHMDHPLTRMLTRSDSQMLQDNETNSDQEDSNSELPSVVETADDAPVVGAGAGTGTGLNSRPHGISCVSSVSTGSFTSSFTTSSSSSCSTSMSTSSTVSSHYSILPSITIKDTEGHFRLVLQSVLLQREDKAIFTAIRQSNNKVDRATVQDDWILYDSDFSMNNLMMMTLRGLFNFSENMSKILFYSMIIVDDAETADDMLDEEATHSGDVSDTQPQLMFDEEDSDSGVQEPQMYLPQKTASHATTAHRSIRTVNSIGEWAYKKKSNATSNHDAASVGSQGNSTLQPIISKPEHIEKHKEDVRKLSVVERWKSLPSKRINGHDEIKKWKLKMKKFKKSNGHTADGSKETFCSIM